MKKLFSQVYVIWMCGLSSVAFARFVTPDPMYLERPDLCVKSPVECNLYSYAKNNPLSYVDRSGMWSEKVHNQIIDATFKSLPDPVRSQIKIGSQATDGGPILVFAVAEQFKSGSAPQHSMTETGIDANTARQIRASFIANKAAGARDYFSMSNNARLQGSLKEANFFEQMAWRKVGEMLHPVQDSTSPAHQDGSGYGDGMGLWQKRTMFSDGLKHGDLPTSIENSINSSQMYETLSRSYDTLENHLPEVLDGSYRQIGIE